MFKTRITFDAEFNCPIANPVIVNMCFGADTTETTFSLPEFQTAEKNIFKEKPLYFKTQNEKHEILNMRRE